MVYEINNAAVSTYYIIGENDYGVIMKGQWFTSGRVNETFETFTDLQTFLTRIIEIGLKISQLYFHETFNFNNEVIPQETLDLFILQETTP